MNAPETTAMLTRIAEEAVPETIDLWPAVRRDTAGEHQARQRHLPWPRWALAGLGAAALIAAVAAGALPVWTNVETVSAEMLLDRAENSAGTITSYHLTMTRQMLAKGNHSITYEVWYGGTDRQRTLEQTLNANGAALDRSDVVFNGSQAWIATTRDGKTHVIHTTGTEWTRPADDPSSGSSVTDVLARYSADKQCMTAQLQGETNVAGRASYVIGVTPKPGACGDAVRRALASLTRLVLGHVDGFSATVTRIQVWVDKQTFLPLKTEVRDGTGALLDQSEVTSVQYDVAIPDSTFQYSPPAGAQVSTFTGGTGADVKRALYSGAASVRGPEILPVGGQEKPSRRP